MAVEVGFIGTGGIARAHLSNLRRIEGVTVRAVSDVDGSRAEQVAAQWEARPHTDCSTMLEQEELDAVYVCLPPAAHGSIEIQLADLRIPFYVEKPIHLDLAVAAQVESMVCEGELITSVGYQLRYSDAVQAARRYLEGRQISLAQGWFIGGLPGAAWWRQKRLSGGQVVEQSTHVCDLLRYLAGEVETVFALASTGAMADVENYDVEDASVAALEFSSGAVGHVVSTCVLTDGGDRTTGLRLDGRGFTVKLNADTLEVADAEGHRSDPVTPPEGGWMARADRAFIDAVRTGDGSAILSSYSDSLKTLALTLAVNRSMQTGEPVSPAELLLSTTH